MIPPDVVRCAYLDLVVSDLAAARRFYVDLLGLHVTAEDESAIYLRCFEEFIHHNLVLRRGPVQLLIVLAEGHLDWDEAAGRFDPDRSDVALPVLTEPG